MSDTPVPEPFSRLRELTEARIGLGRCGAGMPTKPVLEFQLAHARARDAVHEDFDVDALGQALAPRPCILVRSRALDRRDYLRRPDLGRRLAEADATRLSSSAADVAPDVAIVIGDGLSATAVHRNAAPLLEALFPRIPHWTCGPIVLARQARVALGDEIGERLGAKIVLMLIGERPGLTASDSLSVYMTWDPKVGRDDSQRNCISNIRPGGLGHDEASGRLAWLMDAARRLGAAGVGLKDEYSPTAVLPGG
jgi:ethanolamine ammonia-lyase small subunit